MTPARSLHRRALVVVAVAVAALLAGGCRGVSPSTAATVNGDDISRDTVLELLDQRSELPGQTPVSGAGEGTYTSQSFADTLDRYVYDRILRQELERRDVEVTDEERAQARAGLEQSAGADQIQRLPRKLRDFVVDFDAAQVALQRAVAPRVDPAERSQQVAAAYEQQKAALTNACLSVIITMTRPEADAAAARVGRGEAFADVARQVSIDQSRDQGGAAGCQPLGQQPQLIAGDLATAQQGSLLGPYDLQGSFGLVEVTRLEVPTLEQARPQIEAQIPPPGQAELQQLIARLVAEADVDVNPRFGRWDRREGKVEPPAGATPPPSAPGDPAGATSSG